MHDSGRLVAALCGSARQARKHADAGIDIIIAQGGEAGGHTGEIGSMVLWPEVIDAVAPIPVLAAGGIGNGRQVASALAMGAEGVWTGSIWLTVAEADSPPAQDPAAAGRQEQRHGALALVHRQAGAHAQERLDRGLGGAGEPQAARNAPAVHGQWRVRLAQLPLRRAVQGRHVQPGRADRGVDEQGAQQRASSSYDLVSEYADTVERLNALGGE